MCMIQTFNCIFVTMKFSRLLFLIFGLIVLHTTIMRAQTNPNEYVEEKPVLMKNEVTYGLNTHTSGTIGIQFRRSYNLTVNKKRIYEGDFIGMKHPKEVRTVNPYYDNAKSYVFGKLNTFNILRIGTGYERTLYNKAERNGVEIRFVYSGGLSLGITKPIYLEILKPTPLTNQYDIVVEKYDPEIHFIDSIYGRASFIYGINQLRFHPGGYAKIGFNFEYAPIFENVKALEIGAIIDVFPKEIPIMAFTKNKQFFLTFYITLMFGNKW